MQNPDGESSSVSLESLQDLAGALQKLFEESHAVASSNTNKRRSSKEEWLSERPLVEQGPVPSKNVPLESIQLKEVSSRVNQEWSQRILYCRTVKTPFVQCNALWTLVQAASEDDDDDKLVMTLSLWNYVQAHEEHTIGQAIPENTYLAITNPLVVPNTIWTTTSSANDQKHTNHAFVMIRCDNPDCIQLFNTKEEWMRHASSAKDAPPSSPQNSLSPAQLKDKGNEAFSKQAYRAALRYYQQAIATIEQQQQQQPQDKDVVVACLGNMAEACLRSERYDQAEQYARQILGHHDPQHSKAQFRLAKALLHRNQPTAAKDILLQLRQQDDPNTDASSIQTVLGDCLQAILQQSMGKYNYRKLLQEAAQSPMLPRHYADYQSRHIDLGVTVVRPADGVSYRGVLAKQDIPEGTLLTASRAFAFCHHHGKLTTAKKKHLYEVRQVHEAVTMLLNNPSRVPSFYQLEAFGQVALEQQQEQPTIDLARIRSILESNRFGVDLNSPASPFELRPPSEEDDDNDFGVGLWLPTSMFNHSCTPNCTWAQIGNFMFVHAAKPIQKGDELAISYVHAALSYRDRKDKFQRWSGGKGFDCACPWCHLMRSNPELEAMNEEVVQAQKRLSAGEAIRSINDLLSKARRKKIVSAHASLPPEFQHTIYNIHMMEALQCASDMDRKGARKAVEAATSLGYAIRGGLR